MAEIMKITIMVIMSCLMIISVTGQGSYQSTWSTGSSSFSCSDSFDTLKNQGVLNLTLSTSDSVYFFGNTAVDNGNPIIARFDSGNKVWCRDDYDESTNIGTAYGGLADFDNNKLFAAFSTTGSVRGELQQYTRGGWLSTYGNTNNDEVVVILELSQSTGGPTGAGTFLYPLFNGVTNYARLVEWSKPTTDSIEVIMQTGPFPLDVNQVPLTCEYFYGNELYTWTVELTIDLTEVTSSQSTSCDNGNISSGSTAQTSNVSTGSSRSSRSSNTSNTSNTSKTSKTSNTSPKTQSGIFSTHDGTFSRDISSSSSASSLFFSVFVVVFAAALTVF